jgi:MFS family permease
MVRCPNCGRRTEGDYCQWCGYPVLAGSRQRVETGKVRVGNGNWFQRHLNWTWFLVTAVGSYLLGFVLGLIVGSVDPYARYISDEALYGLAYLLGIVLALSVGGWVLRRKSRSLWWLFIFFVPFGWIAFLCLENRSYLPNLTK